jgi:hypothetical protein
MYPFFNNSNTYPYDQRYSVLARIDDIVTLAQKKTALTAFIAEEKNILRQLPNGGQPNSSALSRAQNKLYNLENPAQNPEKNPGSAKILFNAEDNSDDPDGNDPSDQEAPSLI